jgi:hypothetical protein
MASQPLGEGAPLRGEGGLGFDCGSVADAVITPGAREGDVEGIDKRCAQRSAPGGLQVDHCDHLFTPVLI